MAYGKRQDKPKYEDLNPFEYFLDPLTFWKGNPFIIPQKGHKLQLMAAMSRLSATLTLNRLDNYFTSLVDENGNNGVITTTKNVGRQEQAAMELLYNRRMASWWNVNAQMGGYYFINRIAYDQYRETYRRASYSLSLHQTFSLPVKINMEMAMKYHSKRQGGSYDVLKSTGGIDLSFSRSFCQDRLRLSLTATDVLHTERWDGYGTKGDMQIRSWGYYESRKVIVKLSWQWGKSKMKANKAEVAEKERL